MGLHIFLVLATAFLEAPINALAQDNLFDIFGFPEEIDTFYTTEDFLWDTFPATVATDPPLDEFTRALECTSSNPDVLIAKARARRKEGVCQLPIFADDGNDFNWERNIRQEIQERQNAAQREGRVLQFCPPLTSPLCCIGTVEALGVQVNDCEPCISTPGAVHFLLSHEYLADHSCPGVTTDDPLISACTDLLNIYCCFSYGVSFSLFYTSFRAHLIRTSICGTPI